MADAYSGKSTVGTATALTGAVLTVYSDEILFAAQPILRFENIVNEKTELGRAPGATVQFMRYNSLSMGGEALTETVSMDTNPMSSSTFTITVAEYGKAIGVTEMLLRTAFVDTMQDAAQLLGQHLGKFRDRQVRDEALTSTNVKYAAQKAARTDLVATDYFDTVLVKDVVEALAINKAPKRPDTNTYMAYIHPHQSRNMRDDDAWINASNYGSNQLPFTGEIGQYEDVRFIETTMVTNIQSDGDVIEDSVATGTVIATASRPTFDSVYQAIFFGDHAIGRATALVPEMRDNGVEDFGRLHSLAWYGIWGLETIEAGHVFIAESA